MPDRSAERTVDLHGCARCHGDGHTGLTFKPLTHPMEAEPGVEAYTFTHWAMCPSNGEPILMRISEKPPFKYVVCEVEGLELPYGDR